jgi:spermidine/putrescine transport system ATP-binding protein
VGKHTTLFLEEDILGNKIIELKNISKDYDIRVLNKINLYVNENEFLTLLGPSGCGKTTTLRIVGGFEYPTEGDLYFEGKNINNVPPHKRQINTVFQKYALFPHLNIYENIAFGLRIKKINDATIKEEVKKMLKLVNLEGFESRNIDSLSGGQQQRIAIARALVNKPKVLLLDEPLGALDLKLRKEMQLELKHMQREVGITFVYVTHDQEEALTMSDTVVVMNNGEIQQIGTPVDIYNEPENAFVADFIGESNIIDGVMNEDYLVTFLGRTFKCVDYGFSKNESIHVVLRPEDIVLVSENEGYLKGTVTSTIFKGVHYEMIVNVGAFDILVQSTYQSAVGDRVGLKFTPEDIHIMSKEA